MALVPTLRPAIFKPVPPIAWGLFTRFARLRKSRALPLSSSADASRQMAFTFATVALSVRLLQCDTRLSREAFLTFRETFPLENDESTILRKLFSLAWRNNAPAAYYARHAAALYADRPALLKQLLAQLCTIAQAGGIQAKKRALLVEIAAAFGISEAGLSRLLLKAEPHRLDAHALLGLPKNADAREVKQAYRTLMRRYHPDHAHARLHFPEAQAVAERRAAQLTEAYARALRKA